MRHATECVIGSRATLSLAATLDLYSRVVAGWVLSVVTDRHAALRRWRWLCSDVGSQIRLAPSSAAA